MSVNKFTQGEWLLNEEFYICKDGLIVAQPYFVSSDEEVRANAHLIAAAPDLLSACELAKEIFEDADQMHCPDEILKAIAKARGEK